LLILAPLACSKRAASPTVAPDAGAPGAGPPDAAAPGTPPAPVADAGGPGGTAAAGRFEACPPVWTLDPGSQIAVLGGAIVGGAAGVLVWRDGSFYLLLAGTLRPEATAVRLVGTPPSGAAGAGDGTHGGADGAAPVAAPRPVGAVASGGDRFLVVWGTAGPSGLTAWLRAVLPAARILPVNAPGQPGAEGGPVIDLRANAAGEDAGVSVVSFASAVLVEAEAGRAEPAAADYAVLTPTGAPAAADRLGFVPFHGWRLPFARPRLRVDLGDGAWGTLVGPLGGAGLLTRGEPGAPPEVLRVVSPRRFEPFAFEDGWLPYHAGEDRVFFVPGHVLRVLPPQAAASPTRLAAYDGRGRIVARAELPPGAAPLAASRDVRWYLYQAGETYVLCRLGGAAAPPAFIDWRRALDGVRDGTGTCGS
jgi:hypothetical protein